MSRSIEFSEKSIGVLLERLSCEFPCFWSFAAVASWVGSSGFGSELDCDSFGANWPVWQAVRCLYSVGSEIVGIDGTVPLSGTPVGSQSVLTNW